VSDLHEDNDEYSKSLKSGNLDWLNDCKLFTVEVSCTELLLGTESKL